MLYISGKIMPYDDKKMVYDTNTHKYTLTEESVLNELGVDLELELMGESPKVFLNDIREQIYDYIYDNPYPHAKQIAEFRIARLEECRETLYKAMINQVRYVIRTGADIDEYNDKAISKRAKTVLSAYPYLAHKGVYNYRVEPSELGVGY